MRSWRCRISAHRESKRTAFRLLQHNEKSSVPLKEVCTAHAAFERFDSNLQSTRRTNDAFEARMQQKNMTAKRQTCIKLLWNRHFFAANGASVLSIHRVSGVPAWLGEVVRARETPIAFTMVKKFCTGGAESGVFNSRTRAKTSELRRIDSHASCEMRFERSRDVASHRK